MKHLIPLAALLGLFLFSCVPPSQEEDEQFVFNLAEGEWILGLELHDGVILPVNITVVADSGGWVNFRNGAEVLQAKVRYVSKDSIHLEMPYFDSEFHAHVMDTGNRLTGKWFNFSKGAEYAIPFTAESGEAPRFCSADSADMKIARRYEVHFSPDSSENHYPALGIFDPSEEDNAVLGTFATETGDYRFLQGNICGDRLMLSCFDGSHAFLFTAIIQGDSLLDGVFYSGNHWEEPWVGAVNDSFELRDPYSLTQIIDSAAIKDTRFILEDGSSHPLSSLVNSDEVVVLQIMGSWCPNCLDESLFYKGLYSAYMNQGLRIMPLCFESSDDPAVAYKAIRKLENGLDLPYPLYYGGSRKKSSASMALPALDHIMSYPTSIFIDRKGHVRSVHTGFYGPCTGAFYDRYKNMTEGLVQELLSER